MKRWHVGFYISFLVLLVSCSPTFSVDQESIVIKRADLKILPDSTCLHQNSIRNVILSSNQLHSLPNCLKRYPGIEYLDLANNRFEKIPAVVFRLKKLKRLDFSRNPLKLLPDSLRYSERLESLDLWQTDLRELPLYLIEMKQLKEIDVRNTFMKSEDLKWLEEARPDLTIKSSYGCDCE